MTHLVPQQLGVELAYPHSGTVNRQSAGTRSRSLLKPLPGREGGVRQSGRALAELAERVRRVVRACVVQTANMGRNLAGDNSSWRPKLEVWTAYAPAWKEMREM